MTRGALFTDLYEATMACAYEAEGMRATATFELFFRRMPPRRNYVVAAGLEGLLEHLERFRVEPDDVEYLRSLRLFPEDVLERVAGLRFRGDVHAVLEGTIVFPGEPIVQVVAPLPQAQWVETAVLNEIHLESLVATKAARIVGAAEGRRVIDFGSRRAHGIDAALRAARASYLAGAAGTSNLLAGKRFGIPVFGTMAHSYVQAHDDERSAFEAFARLYPGTTLLVDTYDTLRAVRQVVELQRRLERSGAGIGAVRLDSGDLAALARETRRLLDEGGCRDVRIVASGGLDETKIAALVAEGAPIDGFGVGTQMAVSADAPELDLAYKLVEYDGTPRAKLSTEKESHPGRKQVFREYGPDGRMRRDRVVRHDENAPGEPLLRPVMRAGARLPEGSVPLTEARRHASRELERLPERLRALETAREPYPVEIGESLRAGLERLRAESRGERL